MAESHGLAVRGAPLLHFARFQAVRVWGSGPPGPRAGESPTPRGSPKGDSRATMRSRTIPLLALLAAAAAGCAGPGTGGDIRALPAYEGERPVTGAPRITDVALPLLHEEKSVGRLAFGVRPFVRTVETDRLSRWEVLFPLYRTQVENGVTSTRLFPLVWHDHFPTARGEDCDWAVLPILFWGDEPEQGRYFCLFPLFGTMKQKLLSDETTFVLFPLYAGTRTAEWRGHHVLWPLVHWGSDGKGHHAWRAWPFYGESIKEGRYERYTTLWPIVHWSREKLDSPHPLHGWMVFPLVGSESSDEGYRATTVLYPLFQWEDGPRSWERSLPYPFYRRREEWDVAKDGSRTPVSDLFWLWPFYGRYDRGEEEHSRFAAWPLLWWWDMAQGKGREQAVAVAPFFRRVRHLDPQGATEDSWWKLWPLAEGERLQDGSSQWHALALLPWFRWPEFDANWGVFSELARVRRGPDGSRATDLLFSLVRSRTGPGGEHHGIPLVARADSDPTGASWSILEGLLGGETDAGGSSLRLLWFLRIPLSRGNR